MVGGASQAKVVTKRPGSRLNARRNGFSGIIIYVVVIGAVVITAIPVLHILALSMSGREAVLARKVTLIPRDINFNAYTSVFMDKSMQRALGFSVTLTLTYTVFAMMGSILLAYPLCKARLPGRSWLMLFILVPMYFSGGIIPEYLWIKTLKLVDRPLSLLLPVLISTYNTIILRNFFGSIPPSLEESAMIDGAGDFTVLTRIVLPLSVPALATLSLFYAVTRWNTFADVRYYINSTQYYTLQMKLYQVVFNSTDTEVNMLEGGRNAVLSDTIKSAAIVFATAPILAVYPFLQRYFVQGVMIGAVKE
ncbi:MAG: carbohydrate ABC transporter permease [Oscillospiraceae bacterium]|jgi:putative aldouronate transport system permease protein|nr:carbohydrate ABC transporter permease [Oscillospiraceae bacterium]